jgi:hypothetical protein
MARTESLDRGDLINAIWAAQGKVSIVAQRLSVDASTVFVYARKYQTVREAIDGARKSWDEKLLDAAEVKLYEHIMDGKPWAVKYALSTKGKDRGYTERKEYSGPGGLPIELVWPSTVSVDNDA